MKILSFKRISRKIAKLRATQHQHDEGTASQSGLHRKINAYIESNRNRTAPDRETDFLPEILIPCFNHAKYLPNMLKVLSESKAPITVIDDNSCADDQQIIDLLQKNFQFKLIRNEQNLRQGGSLNKAIALSKNNLFLIANADDYLLPGWLEYVIDKFKSSDLRLIGGMHICFFNHFPESEQYFATALRRTGRKANTDLRKYGPADAKNFKHDNAIDMTMTGCAFLKSAWAHVGGFYPLEDRVSIHDDRDFQMRVCSAFQIGISDEISALWRSDSSTGMGTK
jgi:glycosyltransferase involved in cell wall biosynthesis